EALDTLSGVGPPEFAEFALELASLIVSLASNCAQADARSDVERALQSGAALTMLRRMLEAQGGDTSAFDDRLRLPIARLKQPLMAEQDGYVVRLDALT